MQLTGYELPRHLADAVVATLVPESVNPVQSQQTLMNVEAASTAVGERFGHESSQGAGVGEALGRVGGANQPGHRLLMQVADGKGRQVRFEVHIRLGGPCQGIQRRAVEPSSVSDRVAKLGSGHSDGLYRADNIGELK